jgi:hypothetical protein
MVGAGHPPFTGGGGSFVPPPPPAPCTCNRCPHCGGVMTEQRPPVWPQAPHPYQHPYPPGVLPGGGNVID